MITRIEIDGFKSFVDFSVDLPPFLALIGRNASGKSNLVDALAFVAAVARGDRLSDAVALARGDAESLFHRRSDGTPVERMRFALEFLLDPGKGLQALTPDPRVPSETVTRWRYECVIGWTIRPRGERQVLAVYDERFAPLPEEAESWPYLRDAAPGWRAGRVGYGSHVRARLPLPVPAAKIVDIVEDGYRLPDREPPVRRFADEPYALRAALACALELVGISVLRLEPADLAQPSPLGHVEALSPSGKELAGYLQRLYEDTASEDHPQGVLGLIRASLTRVVREVTDFQVVVDEERHDVRLRFTTHRDPEIEATQASDGTLRVLAILAALYDPFRNLLQIAQRSVTDPSRDDPAQPLRQMLVTSHSPLIVDSVPAEQIVFLDTVSRVGGGGPMSTVTRPRHLAEPGETPSREGSPWPPVPRAELARFRAGSAGRS